MLSSFLFHLSFFPFVIIHKTIQPKPWEKRHPLCVWPETGSVVLDCEILQFPFGDLAFTCDNTCTTVQFTQWYGDRDTAGFVWRRV